MVNPPDGDPPMNPVLDGGVEAPSPTDEREATISQSKDVLQRIANAEAQGPTIRQRTQSEIIDLEMLRGWLGNPFSTRWIPFSQLREMTTDLMLAFGWWMTITPLIRAEWSIQSPDAQLAAAVDEALRDCIAGDFLSFSNALWYGHQPIVKRFKLGQLGSTYRNPNGSDPNRDLPTWNSSADALLWKPVAALNPSHCLPRWNENGEMEGFTFSSMPIPHAELLVAGSAYGYTTLPGHFIDSDYAMWITNEQELQLGSVFGSARTSRAYPYWWSYWYRWRLADRSYENLADPAKLVYYPVDFDEFIDPDDPSSESPKIQQARQTALQVGESLRSGSTLAVPGSFAEGADGKMSTMRKWDIKYMDVKNNFSDLDASFRILDILKLRAWMQPEQAYVEGSGSRTSGGSAGGTGGARMATQLGQVAEESQQLLLQQYDDYINTQKIPQFIAANFPEKVGTPCKKTSRALGVLDEQTRAQVFQLIGQVRGEVLPVDTRALLEQMNIPLLNEAQFKHEIEQISALSKIMQPPAQPPEKVGTQGYNAGVMKTGHGNFYYEPPQRIVLAESDGFMNSLPDTPHFQEAASRSALIRFRRTLLDRYQEQYASLVSFLKGQPTLHLAQNGNSQRQGLPSDQAKTSAAAIIGAWAAANAAGAPGHPSQATASGIGATLLPLMTKLAVVGGETELKRSRLQVDDFNDGAVQTWVQDRLKFALDSIDSTVRDEAQGWLEQELEKSVDPTTVSLAAEEHFQGFPASHADRAARTEAVEAYNFGTLEALDRAGVAQVQVQDASNGADTLTDRPCLERNGRIVSLSEARNIKPNHPHCTLAFRALATEKFSLHRVPQLPPHLAQEGRHVAYDEATERLYLTDSVDEEIEREMLLMVGSQLAL